METNTLVDGQIVSTDNVTNLRSAKDLAMATLNVLLSEGTKGVFVIYDEDGTPKEQWLIKDKQIIHQVL